MAPLTQRAFSKRLHYVMDDVLKLRGRYGEVAERAGVARGSLSRWRNPSYKSGPPRQGDLRQLEPVLGLPKGSLLADEETWQKAVNALSEVQDAVGDAYPTLDPAIRDFPIPPLSIPHGRFDPGEEVLWEIAGEPEKFTQRVQKRMAAGVTEGELLAWITVVQGMAVKKGYNFKPFLDTQREYVKEYFKQIQKLSLEQLEDAEELARIADEIRKEARRRKRKVQ
jgi:transcriptional regulator with XRE-family HTH domain